MSILLSLETSTSVCSVALHENGKLLATTELHIPQTASSHLAVMIDSLFKVSNKSPENLAGVVVSAGPGSYTGLRIGVATAKGLCFALNVPLLSVNTLELMTYQVISSPGFSPSARFVQDFPSPSASPFPPTSISPPATPFPSDSPSPPERGPGGEALFCPMLDARRMEVYCLIADRQLNIIESTNAKVIDQLSFNSWLEENRIYFFGSGAMKCRETIKHDNVCFIEGISPTATKLGELGFEKFKLGQFESLSSYEPFYLKDFVAKKPKSV